MKCTFCGAELNDKTYFCTECGRAIESAPEYEFVKTDKKAGKTLGIVSLVLGIVSVVLLLFSLVNICCCLGTMSPIAMITNLVSFALAVPGVIIASIASKKAKGCRKQERHGKGWYDPIAYPDRPCGSCGTYCNYIVDHFGDLRNIHIHQ